MRNVRPPVYSMSGVELGFGLSELAQQLVDYSKLLESVDPNENGLTFRKDSERLYEVAGVGQSRLPKIRMRLLRYATLVVAKQHPDLPSHYDVKAEDEYRVDFSEESPRGTSAVKLAEHIRTFCRELVECEDGKVENLLVQLDETLVQHAYLCGQLWPKLYERNHELELQDD